MNPDKLFTRAVAALPGPIRERLDRDTGLDWTALEDPATGKVLAEAARAHRRLPETVEILVNRLVRDVGIAPADLAAGVERPGPAGAWRREIVVEADGESYRLRNDRGGGDRAGIRPETVAGYAILALELATAVDEAAERWLEAGERCRAAADGTASLPAQCAIAMCAQLRPLRDPGAEHPTTAALADILERVWNDQNLKTRAALAATRLRAGRGARAPRRCYYTPPTGYRLHAFDPGEIRWLASLAERAAAAAEAQPHDDERPEGNVRALLAAPAPAADETLATDMHALEARIRAAVEETAELDLGSGPGELALDRELAELMRAANRLPDAVRRRMRDCYGIGFTQALARLRNTREGDAVRSEVEAALVRHRLPRWLEDLAATLLLDTGIQARNGLRTGGVRLHADDDPGAGYRAIETETGAVGQLAPAGLVEQVRSGLAFALDAWRGNAALRSAGQESSWILDKGEAEGSEFSAGDRETLKAARQMGQLLDRALRANGREAPTALEEAAMTADALKGVGAATPVVDEWNGTAEEPNPRDPDDIVRMAAVAEALHDEIRSIANRQIASLIASAKAYREGSNDDTSAYPAREAPASGASAG